ncbi:hypothetical protein BDZ89DRAFT_1108032 [Hymenopellis radicata]|nr:hypothetical protein BDZ89DRAFT_1108032 [Hymenopellis radicata]
MTHSWVYIWDNPDYDTPAEPQQALVERGEPRAECDVPSRIWTLSGPTLPSTIMIRQEYQEIILGILRWMQHRMRRGITIKEEDVDVDLRNYMPEPSDLGVVHARPLSEMATYANPFLGQEGLTTNGLPTLYAADSRALFWKDGKAYLINLNVGAVELEEALPYDTWCLVDSNAAFPSVPESLIHSCVAWRESHGPGLDEKGCRNELLRHEALGSVWELIAGRQCQISTLRDRVETDLAKFHNLYGGSARHAYSFAHRLEEFDAVLNHAFTFLQPNSIRKTFSDSPSSLNSESTSQLLLSFFPLYDQDRTVWKFESPSPHLQQRLLSRIDNNYERAQKQWFLFNLGAASLGPRAVAAGMFNDFYHRDITCGGSWTLRRMERTPSARQARRSWRTVEEAPKVLVADKEIRIADCKPWSILVSSVPEQTFLEWPVHKPLFVGIYYHPTQRKFATFDSFFVDGIGHAITFQASISRWHDVSPSGKAWLEERGIRKVTSNTLVAGPGAIATGSRLQLQWFL